MFGNFYFGQSYFGESIWPTQVQITGSTTLTFSLSSFALGAGALAGTSTLTFALNGTVRGSGAFSGASGLTFAPGGSMIGSGAIAGASTLIFSLTGTELGAGTLSGTSTLSFTGAGTLNGVGLLADTSFVDFTPTGTLTGNAAASGTVTLTLSLSATAQGDGELAGASALLFTLSGTGKQPVLSATTGGGSGRLVRYFSDRRSESTKPLVYAITHRSIASCFEGASTFTATLSARAVIKSEFTRSNALNGRIKGRARTRTVIASNRMVASMKVVGRIAIRTRGPVRMKMCLSGISHSQMRCVGIENPPEDILKILER